MYFSDKCNSRKYSKCFITIEIKQMSSYISAKVSYNKFSGYVGSDLHYPGLAMHSKSIAEFKYF